MMNKEVLYIRCPKCNERITCGGNTDEALEYAYEAHQEDCIEEEDYCFDCGVYYKPYANDPIFCNCEMAINSDI